MGDQKFAAATADVVSVTSINTDEVVPIISNTTNHKWIDISNFSNWNNYMLVFTWYKERWSFN